MTLYYIDEEATIAAILSHGFLAVLGSDRKVLCCDRSQIGLGPADMPQPLFKLCEAASLDGLAEMAFEVEADVSDHEVYPTDLHPGRYFDIPVTKIEEMIQ